MISISVALVTRNRPESLNRCLESLRAQDTQPYEVIVSDDSDLDRAHETESVAQKWNCKCISGPRRGLYANRNHAALACSGTHVRTMDDDHLFPEKHFSICYDAVCSDPASIWTTGEIVFFNGERYMTFEQASQLSPSGVAMQVDDPDDNWAIADGSTIYPKRIFEDGYRMLECFGYGSSYLEFGAYLYSHGIKSRCIPHACIEHYPEDDSLLRRDMTREAVISHIFSAYCYNTYFRPNFALVVRYLLPKIIRYGCAFQSLDQSRKLLWLARQRWHNHETSAYC